MRSIDVIRMTALTAMVINILLTLCVLGRDYKSRLHRVYMVWGAAVTLWNWGAFNLSQTSHDISYSHAFFWAKILQVGVIFLPLSMFHLCLVISRTQTHRFFLPVLYGLHLGLAASVFCNWYIKGVRELAVGWWSIPGPGFRVFSVFYVALISGIIVVLYRKQKSAPPLQRKRIRAMLCAVLALWILGSNDLMPIMNMDYYPFTHIRFYPIGGMASVIYVVMVAYSVLQLQLLDIHVTLSRYAAQMVRFLFMTLLGFFLLLMLSHFRPEGFSAFSLFSFMVVLAISALAASLLFPRFFGHGGDALERRLLGDRFEYHARVKNFIENVRSYPDPEPMLQELDALLVNTMRVGSFQVVLRDDTIRGFVLLHSHPAAPKADVADIGFDSPVYRYFLKTRAKSLSCELMDQTEHETMMQRDARRQLKPFESEFCFPFYAADDVIGFLLTGPKSNGEMVTVNDLRLLVDLSETLAQALNQVRLRHQLQAVHEQDLMGRMSGGLAHDLNNLLTPVQTLLQLLRESQMNQETINELLPMGLRNLETVRTYINEALFFSRSNKLNGKAGRFDETVREAAALIQSQADAKGVAIRFESLPEAEIEMDAVLVKRLVCNLLSNAVDASPAGAAIEIALSLLPAVEPGRDWFRLKIIDHGEGISAENLQRVFTPYFTTKNTGDGKRGFGLGLAIAKKIVHLHGGNLSIASKEKKGTTLQVDLPSRLAPAGKPAADPARERFGMVAA